MANDSMLLELEDFPAFQNIGKLWDLLRRDGYHFDQFSVGNTDRALGDDPLAKLNLWVKKPGTRILQIDHGNREDQFLYLTRFRGMSADLKLRFEWGARSVEGWLGWLEELLKLGPLGTGVLSAPAIPSSNLYEHGPQASWLFLCGGEERKKLEGAGVPKYLQKKGAFLRTVKSTLIIGLTKSPFTAFKGGVASLKKPVDDLLLDAVEKKAKVDVLKLTRAAFAKVLGPKGYTEVRGGHRRELLWKHGPITIDAGMSPHNDFKLAARHQGTTPTSYYPWFLAEGTVPTTAKTLERGLKIFLENEARFLKNPKRFR